VTERAEYPIAHDGHIARVVEEWNTEKLFYVDRYMDIFCTGMHRSWPNLVYADMLAGPGMCIDSDSGAESPGSPMLAIGHRWFGRLFLNDAEPSVTASLSARVRAKSPAAQVRVSTGDCNQVVEDAREFLFPEQSWNRTLGLAVIDPSAFQMRFDSIARLTAGIRLDLLIVFMTGFVRRFIATGAFEEVLDGFYGTPKWREILLGRDQGERVTFRKLLDLYEAQLATLNYVHVNDDARILNSKRSTIYHIVFASKHPRGAEFFEKISQRTYRGQQRFPGLG
jgi:three-Cys-motif partner protein